MLWASRRPEAVSTVPRLTSPSPSPSEAPSSSTRRAILRYARTQFGGLHRADDEERAERLDLEVRRRVRRAEGDRLLAVDVRRVARVEHPQPVAERLPRALQRAQRQRRVRPGHDELRQPAAPVPGPEIERLVAEQDVVGPCDRRDVGSGSRPCPRRARSPRPCTARASGACPRRSRRGSAPGCRARRRAAPSAALARRPGSRLRRRASAKNGRMKIRCRDSGAAEPSLARTSATSGTTTTSATSTAPRGFRRASAEEADEREEQDDVITGVQPAVKSPATISRRYAIDAGLPRARRRRRRRRRRTGRRARDPCARTGSRATSDGREREHRLTRSGARVSDARTRPARRARARRTGAPRRTSRSRAPTAPTRAAAALGRVEQREERERAREEEEAVHPPVDAVEEQHPAGRATAPSPTSAGRAAGEPRPSRATTGTLADGEERRHQPERRRAPAECATIQANRKCSGAPPRWSSTVSNRPRATSGRRTARASRPRAAARPSAARAGTSATASAHRCDAELEPAPAQLADECGASRPSGLPTRPQDSWPFAARPHIIHAGCRQTRC